ncbi:bifunctional diaminohydroxyphosphoribosylaminopyrimidine deaminase/5-amino-6-(5-phosphoribosylamino)uracil reductase RibD [Silvanigrella paludirubra]|uniref:Riboflavin biosynthesis protein RibD n=2 Tax=Silvanigrella paludirubra TaxID=2499159 RepID=A0A6N6VW37_9BACT|nr:bifunctional diaminohydroxyphosphoribosylaminopyrimidine deaminase/5-amino-6-(5-phosphoribosylamino)uracil reductase RibD [Silvanigrella paludirubra]
MLTNISTKGRQLKMSFSLKKGFTFGGWLPHLFPNMENIYPPLDTTISHSDEYWLFRTFLESMKNASISNPNPSVGCLIVKNNNIISSGCTESWGNRHAERVAFQNISAEDLKNSSVYITLEPCTHQGRQPPCSELFKNKDIGKVVVGCIDPNPVVSNQGIQSLINLGIGQTNFFLSNEIKAWNYPFFIQQQKNKLFIALKWAQSLDGCLADDNDGWQWISGEQSRTYAHWLRQKYDAIMVGIGTVLNDFPSLDIRNLNHINQRNPLKMIYDPEGKIFSCNEEQQKKLLQKTLQKGSHKIFIVDKNIFEKFRNSKQISIWQKNLLENNEIEFINYQGENKLNTAEYIIECLNENNSKILNFLGRPLQSIMIEGGHRLLSSFIQENHFDIMHIFTAPFFLGGEKHKLFSKVKRSYQDYSIKEVKNETRYHIAAQALLGEDNLLEIIKK